jgi:hypothetical protein
MFLLLCVVLLAGLFEAGSFVFYWFRSGRTFSYTRFDEQRSYIAAGEEQPEQFGGIGAVVDYITIHPYIGFVYDTKATVTDDYLTPFKAVVNPFGMTGPSPIQKRAPNRLIVGVAGGSVAHDLVLEAQDHLVRLLQELPQYRGREIVVVVLAMGGLKQPQQLMMLHFFLSEGAEFDLLINLDGFNEIVASHKHIEDGVFPSFPTNWPGIAAATPDRDMLIRVGRLFEAQERRRATARWYSNPPLHRSITAQLFWKLRDRWLEEEIQAARIAIHDYQRPQLLFREVGPGAQGWKGPRRFELIADIWRRCSIEFDRACRAHDIRYFHFLQPNQYLDKKPMGDAERRVAYQEDYPLRPILGPGYRALQQTAPELQRAGVRYRDLTGMFKDVKEPLYEDNCCHLNRRGNELLAKAIVDTIAEAAALESSTLLGIRVEPASLTIDDPLVPQRAHVWGRFSDGKERLVSAAHFGTTYRSSDPCVVVTADGELRGLREGSARVTVHNRDFTAELLVTSRWRQVAPFGIGVPGSGELTPVLDALGEPRIGNEDFKLRVRDARGGAAGVLIASERVPEHYPNVTLESLPPDQLTVLNVRAGGAPDQPGKGIVELPFPIPNDPSLRGRTSYLQVLFKDEAAAGGRSLSNGLRVTVR